MKFDLNGYDLDNLIKKLYLKTVLINYYEKFGAIFLENLNTGERLYYFSI